MPQFRVLFALSACVACLASQATIAAVAVGRLGERAAVAVGTMPTLWNGTQAVYAANRRSASHVLSPGASDPVAHHVLTPQQRALLRQQIRNTARSPTILPQGSQAQSQK